MNSPDTRTSFRSGSLETGVGRTCTILQSRGLGLVAKANVCQLPLHCYMGDLHGASACSLAQQTSLTPRASGSSKSPAHRPHGKDCMERTCNLTSASRIVMAVLCIAKPTACASLVIWFTAAPKPQCCQSRTGLCIPARHLGVADRGQMDDTNTSRDSAYAIVMLPR